MGQRALPERFLSQMWNGGGKPAYRLRAKTARRVAQSYDGFTRSGQWGQCMSTFATAEMESPCSISPTPENSHVEVLTMYGLLIHLEKHEAV